MRGVGELVEANKVKPTHWDNWREVLGWVGTA